MRRHAALGGGILGAAVGLHGRMASRRRDAVRRSPIRARQPITHVGRYRWRTGGRMGSAIVGCPGGGVRALSPDDSPETYYVHTPGVKVAVRRRLPTRRTARRHSRPIRLWCSSQARVPDVAGRCPRATTSCRSARARRARGHPRRSSAGGRWSASASAPPTRSPARRRSRPRPAHACRSTRRRCSTRPPDGALCRRSGGARTCVSRRRWRRCSPRGDPRPPRAVLRVTGYDVRTRTGSSRTGTCPRGGSWTRFAGLAF